MAIFIILLGLAESLLLANNISVSWSFGNNEIKFLLKHQQVNTGYIGIGIKSISGRNSMDESNLWIFNLDSNLASDHKGEGNGFPELDYENNLLDVIFDADQKQIQWKRRFKTGDCDDIDITYGKYLMLWCIGDNLYGEIIEHGFGDKYRGIVQIEFSNAQIISCLLNLWIIFS